MPVQTTPLANSLENIAVSSALYRELSGNTTSFLCRNVAIPSCTHFVGFRDDRYWNAVRVFGRPHFIHRWWDKRARREIAADDTVVFATGDWTQPPSPYNAPDITEDEP